MDKLNEWEDAQETRNNYENIKTCICPIEILENLIGVCDCLVFDKYHIPHCLDGCSCPDFSEYFEDGGE